MKEYRVRSMSSFQWGSTARYVAYIEQIVGLRQVSDLEIYSFRMNVIGLEKLIKKKRRTKKVLEGNLSALATWVGENRETLEENERVVLRSYYMGIKAALEVVDTHLRNAKELEKWFQLFAFNEEERKEEDLGDDEDDSLF